MELTKNTILVTGGTGGFGLEFAAQLLALGNTVIITGRDQAKLDYTKTQLPGIHIFQSDVSNPKAIAHLYEQVIAQFPELNILINNAGEMRRLNLLDDTIDVENVNKEIAINLSGPIRMVQQFLPHLRTKKTAAILNVTSGLALVPFPLAPIYGATKSGLRSYTRSLRVQLKKTGIKVFELIAPSANTALNDKFANDINSKLNMEPGKLIATAIKGLKNDTYEVYPGAAVLIKIMSRLAPNFIFNQMAKITEKAFA